MWHPTQARLNMNKALDNNLISGKVGFTEVQPNWPCSAKKGSCLIKPPGMPRTHFPVMNCRLQRNMSWTESQAFKIISFLVVLLLPHRSSHTFIKAMCVRSQSDHAECPFISVKALAKASYSMTSYTWPIACLCVCTTNAMFSRMWGFS